MADCRLDVLGASMLDVDAAVGDFVRRTLFTEATITTSVSGVPVPQMGIHHFHCAYSAMVDWR